MIGNNNEWPASRGEIKPMLFASFTALGIH